MSSPRHSARLSSALAFLGSAALMAILGTGAARIAQRHGPPLFHPATSAAFEAFAPMLKGRPAQDIWRMIGERDAAFWQSDPNAAPFMRQAGAVLVLTESPTTLLESLRESLQERTVSERAMTRLLSAAFCGMLEARPMTQSEFVAVAKTQDKTLALACLELWLEWQKTGSLKSDVAGALAIAAEVFGTVDKPLTENVTAMVVRIWAHRAPAMADVLAFALEAKHPDLRRVLLNEGARILAVANPGELKREFLRLDPDLLHEAAGVAGRCGLSFREVFEIASAMPEPNRSQFLEGFLETIYEQDPREMLKVAAAYPASKLASTAGFVASGFARSGDYGGLQTWMAELDSTARAKLWDATISSGEDGPGISAADARTYLANRPADVPATESLSTALAALPLEEARRDFQLTQDVNEDLKTEIARELVYRQFRQLREEHPEEVAAFLSGLPKEDRQDILRHSLEVDLGGTDSSTLESWAAAATDPEVRESLEKQRLSAEMETGNLATAEALALRSLQNATGTAAEEGPIGELIGHLAQIDSSRVTAFLEQLPAGDFRDQAIASFVRTWAEIDPVSASDWLAGMPPTPGRDLAVRELIKCSRDDPERALANAAAIHDPKLRMEAARSVLRVWRDSDPARGAESLSGAGFNAEELPVLRAMLGGQP